MRAWIRTFGLLVATAALVACSSVPPPEQPIAGELFTGRIAIHVAGTDLRAERAMNASFELEGGARAGKLHLATSTGTLLAKVRWVPGQALLVTPQYRSAYADLDSLTAELLGESIPLAALFDWLRGRPWPDAASEPNIAPAPPGFRQLGWAVRLDNFDQALISARRESAPAVTVRAKLDRD